MVGRWPCFWARELRGFFNGSDPLSWATNNHGILNPISWESGAPVSIVTLAAVVAVWHSVDMTPENTLRLDPMLRMRHVTGWGWVG
jgi:hypothetical protein